jgi:hypothetical protein
MAVYCEEIRYELYINDEWVNISKYVQTVSASWGISGTSRLDRVADVGEISLDLKNENGRFTPGSINSIAGFGKGNKFRMTFVYVDEKVKFLGRINEINLDLKNKVTRIKAVDYFFFLENIPLTFNTVLLGEDISGISEEIISLIPEEPNNTVYHHGTDTFEVAFDQIGNSTTAIQQFNYLTRSELGWIYLKHNPETLVVEGRYTRSVSDRLAPIPKNDEYATTENNELILFEDNSSWILDYTQDAIFNNLNTNAEVSYGSNISNVVTAKIKPRSYSSSPVALYTESQIISLSAGESRTYTAKFQDPANKAVKICGKNMVNPVSTTDYLMYANADGSGTNLTAYLTVSCVFFTDSAEITITNSYSNTGYVTKLILRGTGIYQYSDLEYTAKDSESVINNLPQSLNLDMKYQSSYDSASNIANKILQTDKDPKTMLDEITFLANKSDLAMLSFINCDIGDLVLIKDNENGINDYFYINKVKFNITPGGIITFSWLVIPALSLTDVYWILDSSQLGINTILGY